MQVEGVLLYCREVWEKYVEFESNVGDLASLLKVEKRRAAAMRADSRQVCILCLTLVYPCVCV